MASKNLTFQFFAKDNASGTMKQVNTNAQKMADGFKRVGAAVGVGLAVAGAAAVAFGISSVRAFADAQAAQERLNFAYAKFPALLDVTRVSFDKLNTVLQNKTGFDDDLIASSQGMLAQFGLTGKQIQKLTPLMLDYARANGKDLATSAEDLGKALMGQGRALKAIGIDFDDAGSTAANFDQLMAGLTTNVGGYAETFGTTAAGKFEILTMKWGDFQEKVGEALLPGLVKLMEFAESNVMPALTDFAEWFAKDGVVGIKLFIDKLGEMKADGTLIPAVVGGLSAVTLGVVGMNAVLALNPIGLVVLALAALVAQFTYVTTNLEAFKRSARNTGWGIALTTLFTGWFGLIAAFAQNWDMVWRGMQFVVVTNINGMIGALNLILTPINLLIGALNGLFGLRLSRIAIPGLAMPSAPAASGGGTFSAPRGRAGGRARAFAEGGLVKGGRGGVFGMIGEKQHDELVVPLKPGMGGLGGMTVNVIVNGSVLSDERKLATAVRDAVKSARSQGFSTQGAFA